MRFWTDVSNAGHLARLPMAGLTIENEWKRESSIQQGVWAGLRALPVSALHGRRSKNLGVVSVNRDFACILALDTGRGITPGAKWERWS